MQDFITIEMHFHAKALELYTQSFQTIEAIDTEADLEVTTISTSNAIPAVQKYVSMCMFI